MSATLQEVIQTIIFGMYRFRNVLHADREDSILTISEAQPVFGVAESDGTRDARVTGMTRILLSMYLADSSAFEQTECHVKETAMMRSHLVVPQLTRPSSDHHTRIILSPKLTHFGSLRTWGHRRKVVVFALREPKGSESHNNRSPGASHKLLCVLWLFSPSEENQKKPRVRKNFCPQFWGQKWRLQFYRRLEKLRSFCRTTPMPIKFLVFRLFLGEGGIWVLRGGADFIFMGAGIF